ncbi:hypothetical protein F4802DRAFT_252407 [Xylaria palmicola]|nr:hypothetical protein F4802DRAFT_252407 [Xylaria palmicola]
MAISGAVPPPPELGAPGSNGHSHEDAPSQPSLPTNADGVDIEAWTVSALQSLSVSPVARGTGAPLSIPLDEARPKPSKPAVNIYDPRARSSAITPPPRPLSRRDSMKRREALLKGTEGSRQRRRWENDRLLHVPNAIPPEPQDYVPRPTHPVTHVPYAVAAAWELRVRADVEARTAALARRKQALTRTLGDGDVAGRVPRELCQRAKKTPAVRAWVRSLEEPVREYLVTREVARPADADLMTDDDSSESSNSDLDSEDEEIVFVGRNRSGRGRRSRDSSREAKDGAKGGADVGGQWKRARREDRGTGATRDEGMLFDAFGDDDGGAFRRWLTHSISDYYGLESRSVLVGDPERKVVYVGVEQMKTGRAPSARAQLPRPLWELC